MTSFGYRCAGHGLLLLGLLLLLGELFFVLSITGRGHRPYLEFNRASAGITDDRRREEDERRRRVIMAHADWIIDLGPGAGHDGGLVVFEGTPAELIADGSALTGKHLSEYVGS